MLFRIVPSPKSPLSLQQILELSNIYLENAFKATDHDIVLILCHDAEAALAQVKSSSKKILIHSEDSEEQALREGVATAYIGLGKLLDNQGYPDEAQTLYEEAEKLGGNIRDPVPLAQSTTSDSIVYSGKGSLDSAKSTLAVHKQQQRDIAAAPPHIFANV
ncbi:hypothetical protein BGZ65_006899, partial [Modicella reniformis]